MLLMTVQFNIPELAKTSLVDVGDTARFHRVFEKSQRGEKITIGVIGGSITAGASATKPELRYANRITDWWKQKFPKAQVELINAGIGATGSDLACLRVQRDLLAHNPDVVIVEFGVNDPNIKSFAETYEGTLRQILSAQSRAAVILLFVMDPAGKNSQEWQEKLGRHYRLPMVSYRDALWPQMQAGRLKWEDISPDVIHPNDFGHDLVAKFLIHAFEAIKKAPPASSGEDALPAPMLTDLFQHTTMLTGSTLKPTTSTGWTYDEKGQIWITKTPGSVIEVPIEGRQISVTFFKLKSDMGKAKVTVDNRPPVVIDGWFEATWGGAWQTTSVARDINPEMHRVKIELLTETSPNSHGHEFRIMAVSAAGVAH
jgi:lysophospholipase L1-like esterase